MENDDDPEDWKIFYNKTREYVVFLMIFLVLYLTSYCLICMFKRKRNFLLSDTYEDAIAYRITLWICTFSLGISIGAALLLPMSIIGNEFLIAYPNYYYVQWLNSSLIQGLWSLVFLCSNLALFVLLPFAHIFIESEGLPGSQKGVKSRVYEATLVLCLLTFITMGLIYIFSSIFNDEHYSIVSVFNVYNYYLPFLYSCVSFLGVLMLLICTPVGFARLFTVPNSLFLKQRNAGQENSVTLYYEQGCSLQQPRDSCRSLQNPDLARRRKLLKKIPFDDFIENGKASLNDYKSGNKVISYIKSTGLNVRNCAKILCPLMTVLPLVLTIVSVVMVTLNAIQLCFGVKALPLYTQNLSLGMNSLSSLGLIGAALEVVLILYLWCTSIIGLYSLPKISHLRPRLNNTSMTQVIGNCSVLLVLSSALPVLTRSLGITNFDLLGDFGRINWLGNFYIVLFHNVVFAGTAVVCLGTKLTKAMRNELYRVLHRLCRQFFPC